MNGEKGVLIKKGELLSYYNATNPICGMVGGITHAHQSTKTRETNLLILRRFLKV